MLEIALKIPEIIMPLLINALRCLIEPQRAQTRRAVSVTAKIKNHRAQVRCVCTVCPDTVREQLIEVPWNLFQLAAVTWSKRISKYCVSILSLVSAILLMVSLLLFRGAGLGASEVNRPGPNREILSLKNYNVPTWEFWLPEERHRRKNKYQSYTWVLLVPSIFFNKGY